MDVKILKLITGEEVLGEIEIESETEFVLINPVGIAIVRGKDGQPNVGFAPFPTYTAAKKDDTIDLNLQHVVYSYKAPEDFHKNYEQVFGVGLIVPGQQQIITG